MKTTINPYTQKKIKTWKLWSDQQIQNKLELSHKTFQSWSTSPLKDRLQAISETGQTLRKQKDILAKTITLEMGKPIKDSLAEVEKCALLCDYYSKNGEEFLKDKEVSSSFFKSYVRYEPLGISLGIMPWNFPFWQVFRFAIPTLLTGNTAILKHASNTFGCADKIEKVFSQTLPKNVFLSFMIKDNQTEKVIRSPYLATVSFTGSSKVGAIIGSLAGKHLKKSILELGGSDPYLILEDADLENAAKSCSTGRLINSGQSCIAAKRFIVHTSIKKKFEELMIEQFKKKVLGNPLEEEITMGPMARKDLRDNLHRQVKASLNQGAKCLMGGIIPKHIANFYPPTILTNVKLKMTTFQEETFGPVANIIEANSEEEMIRLANKSIYGLGSAIFTQNIQAAREIAHQLQSGSCFINDYVRSDPALPFGGVKNSGYGRELASFGLHEFCNIKTYVEQNIV